MLPYFLLYPIWLLVSLIWPSLQSLHALHTEEPATMKLWLFYWVLYAVSGWVWEYTFLAYVLELPFYLVSALLVDLFFEAQIAVVFLLVNPKQAFLDKLLSYVEANLEPGSKKLAAVVEQGRERFSTLYDQLDVDAVLGSLKKGAGKGRSGGGLGGKEEKGRKSQ
mmetsp:Transcript_7659/g.18526  ORF Transcript_7659/g.18526 Transcript_7659/m.18526 type:complete len:165 (+) Transcript_7659:241-735(+)|eukprot:g7357.t1